MESQTFSRRFPFKGKAISPCFEYMAQERSPRRAVPDHAMRVQLQLFLFKRGRLKAPAGETCTNTSRYGAHLALNHNILNAPTTGKKKK